MNVLKMKKIKNLIKKKSNNSKIISKASSKKLWILY